MDFEQVVRKRRMVRKFKPDPVPPESLDRILKLARKTPSAGFSQGQSFVVITDRSVLHRLIEAYGGGPSDDAGMAPVQIIVCTSEKVYRDRYSEPDKLLEDGTQIEWPVPYWHVDAGASMMLLLLAAVDERLAAWFYGLDDYTPLKEVLQIPDHVTPVGLVALGYPAKDEPSPSLKRGWKQESEVVHYNGW